MYIRSVKIENLKCIRHIDFNFEHGVREYAGWSVITGDNSAGKTSLLKAIALALIGPDASRILQPSFRGWVTQGASEGYVAVSLQPNENDRFDSGRRYEKPFWSELKLSLVQGPEVTLSSDNRYRKEKKGPIRGPWADNQAGWFSLGYGPFRRLYGSSSQAQRLMSGPSKIARFATMFKEDATLEECEIWLKDLNHKSLEGKMAEKRILEQVVKLLNSDFLRCGIVVDKVDSDGLWLRTTKGVNLPLSDMSEGYRAALAMLLDIIRHMVSVYGDNEFLEEADDLLCVKYPGVVLIDEIDAHLHPAWQREIGMWLQRKFPRIQFIVSTHSPFICQQASQNMIFHLPGPDSKDVPKQITEDEYNRVIAAKADTIYLSSIFSLKDTRSPTAVSGRMEFARLRSRQSSGSLTEAEKERLGQLKLFAEIDD